MESSVNTELLRSRVDTFILNSLNEKDGYGYDILSYIYTKTQGHYEMKQSSIYSVLKRLEKQGYIKSYLGEESKGGQRRYYSLTDQGRAFLDAEQQQWAYTRTLLDNLVTQKEFDLEKDTPPFKASDLRPLTRRNRDDETEENEEPKEQAIPPVAEQEEQTEAFTILPSFPTSLDEAPSAPPASAIEQKPVEKTGGQILSAQKLFEAPSSSLLFTNTDTGREKTVPSYRDEPPKEKENDRAAYRTLFGGIYAQKPDESKQAAAAPIDDELSCHHINDLKNVLKNEGYTLKTYKKDEMLGDYTRNKMYYSNKLLRDCCILTFLFYTLATLVIYRFRTEFSYSGISVLVAGLIGLVLPFFGLIKFFIEPKKRIKSVFNFRVYMAYAVMALLLVFVFNLIISLVTPSIGLTLSDLKLYPPVILALVMPVSVLFYQILFKSGFYNIKL